VPRIIGAPTGFRVVCGGVVGDGMCPQRDHARTATRRRSRAILLLLVPAGGTSSCPTRRDALTRRYQRRPWRRPCGCEPGGPGRARHRSCPAGRLAAEGRAGQVLDEKICGSRHVKAAPSLSAQRASRRAFAGRPARPQGPGDSRAQSAARAARVGGRLDPKERNSATFSLGYSTRLQSHVDARRLRKSVAKARRISGACSGGVRSRTKTANRVLGRTKIRASMTNNHSLTNGTANEPPLGSFPRAAKARRSGSPIPVRQ